MNQKIQRMFVAILVLMFSVSLPQLPAYSTEATANEKAMAFLSEVSMIDQTKQNVTLHSYGVNPFESAKEDISYTIESSENKWDALLQLKNGAISAYSLRIGEGSELLYTQLQSAEVLDDAKNFLQRYYNFKKNTELTMDVDLEKMVNIIDTVNELTTTTKTVDNLRFQLICEEKYTNFNWITTINGADYSTVSLSFEESCFSFMDNRNRYAIGNTDVNLTTDEAVNIALKAVENYSYTVNGTKISGFKIAENHITAKLLTRPKDSMLQPYWAVELGLEELYPGNIYAIRVNLWAGTPEIIECFGLGFSGDLMPKNSTTDTTNLELENTTTLTIDNILIGTAIVGLLAIVIIVMIIKKRRK
ncbi:MAG: hypothetical protein QCH99_01230 [Candidatus Bathyarchaeota archaeon]|nr:hypothetical protein [Candidatus Bathyarchaeum tardum]WGM89327.1 MAG: hypothetical protein NUK63_10545 [Candidatus Bathyarchaeum tardum]